MVSRSGDYEVPNVNINNLFNDLSMFTFLDKYSLYLPEQGRRETWLESVTRSVNSLRSLSENKLPFHVYQAIFDGIYDMSVLPSMRLFSMKEEAILRDNSVIYNCSFIGIDSLQSISELLYLGCSGVGTGFSVEKRFISKLPVIKPQTGFKSNFQIADTQQGWAVAFKFLLEQLFIGCDVDFDYSLIRPAGSRLKTKGGYASGPECLNELFQHARKYILSAQGRQLTSIEVLDICNFVSNAAISGGSRRSAQIALGDPDDNEFISAKTNITHQNWRWNSNNSAVWSKDTPLSVKKDLLHELYTSGGEPGIFNRDAAIESSPNRRNWNQPEFIGTNPCGEINLEHRQFCNLSTAIIRHNDSKPQIAQKIQLASIIGTIQSMATNFPFIDKQWKENQERDRLLGVCITGVTENNYLRDDYFLREIRDLAIGANAVYADKLQIGRSTSITSVKPAGNTSVTANTTPGANARNCMYSIRNVVVNGNSAMSDFLTANGVPSFDHPGRKSDRLFKFPDRAPDGSLTQKDFNALRQCELWKLLKDNYTEHNVSVTIQYEPHEFQDLEKWILNNANIINGMAFFKNQNFNFAYLPIQEVSKEEYFQFESEFPKLNWNNFHFYERALDERHEVAECAGGNCTVTL